MAPFGNEILVAVTRGLLGAIDGRGVDRGELLAAAGVSDAEVADPDAWLAITRHVRLGQLITEALPGQNLGLQTGARIFGDPRGALGYTLRRSEQHWRALRNFCSYLGVVNLSLATELSLAPNATSLTLHMVPELAELAHPAEALFAAWVAISRHLTDTVWAPAEVSFSHQPRGDVREHEEFFGCPVLFGRPSSRLLLPASAWALPIASSPHELEHALLLARDDARALAAHDASTLPAIEEYSVELCTVPLEVGGLPAEQRARTLPARLALAGGLLRQSHLFVHEVAFLLSFEGVRDFEQAFTNRFGESPRALST